MYCVPLKISRTFNRSVSCFIIFIYFTQLFLKVQCQIIYIGQPIPVLRKDISDHVLVPIASPIVGHFTTVKPSNSDKTQVTFKDRLSTVESTHHQVTSYKPRNVIPTTESILERSKPTVSVSDKIDLVSKSTNSIRPTIGVIGLKYNFDDVWKPDKKLIDMSDEYIKQDMEKQNNGGKEGEGFLTNVRFDDSNSDEGAQKWGLTTTEKYEDYSIKPLNIWQAERPEINKQLFGEPSKESYQTTSASDYPDRERTHTKQLQGNQSKPGFLIEPSIEIWEGKQITQPEQSTLKYSQDGYHEPNDEGGVSVEIIGSQQNYGQNGYYSEPTQRPHLSTHGYQQLNNQPGESAEITGPGENQYPSTLNHRPAENTGPEPIYGQNAYSSTPKYQPVENTGPGQNVYSSTPKYQPVENTGPGQNAYFSTPKYHHRENTGPGQNIYSFKPNYQSAENTGPGENSYFSTPKYHPRENNGPGQNLYSSKPNYQSAENTGPEHTYGQNVYSTANYQPHLDLTKRPPYQAILHHKTPPIKSFQSNQNWREDFGHGKKPKYESVNGRWLLNGGPILQNNFFGGKTEGFHGWGGFYGDGGSSQSLGLRDPNGFGEHSGHNKVNHKNHGFGGSNKEESSGYDDNRGNQNGSSGLNHKENSEQDENRENNNGYSGPNHEENSGHHAYRGNHNGYHGSNDEGNSSQEENSGNHNEYSGSNDEENSSQEENRGNYNVNGGSNEDNSREENPGNYNGSNDEENPPQNENHEERDSSEENSKEEPSPTSNVNDEDKSKEDYRKEDKASSEHSEESGNADPYPDRDFGTDAAYKPPPPDHDESRERNRVSDHEYPRKIPTRLQYRGGGLWAKDSGVDLGWVPKQVYSQVRKYDTVKHLPRSAALAAASTQEEIINAPRLREVVSHKKVQEVYEEEGYEDSAYNHGGYNKHGEHSEDKMKNYSSNDHVNDPVRVPTEEEAHQEHAEKIKEVDQIDDDTQGSAQKQVESIKAHPDVRGTWKSQKVTTNEKSMTFAGDDGRGGILTEKLAPRLEGSVGKYILVDGKRVPFVQELKDVPGTIISHGGGVSYQRFYQPTILNHDEPEEDDKLSETPEFNLDSALEGSAFIPDTDSKVILSKNPITKELKPKKHYDSKIKKIPIKFLKPRVFTTTESSVEYTTEDIPVSTTNPTDDEQSTTTEREEVEEQTGNPVESSVNYKIEHKDEREPNVETYSSRSVYLTSKQFSVPENNHDKENIPPNHKPAEEKSNISSVVTPILYSRRRLFNTSTKIPIPIRKSSKYGKEILSGNKNLHDNFPIVKMYKPIQNGGASDISPSSGASKPVSHLNAKVPTFLAPSAFSRFDDSIFSPSEESDSIGDWSIHQTAFKTFNDKLDSSWDKFTPVSAKSHNSIHVVRRSNRKYQEIPRNNSARTNDKTKEATLGSAPVWEEEEDSRQNIRHPFLPKDDNGEPVELIFEVRTTEKPRATTTAPTREPVKIETVIPVQKTQSRRKPAPKQPSVPTAPVTRLSGDPHLSLKPVVDSGNIPADVLSKLQSNVYLAAVYNVSKPPEPIMSSEESSQNDSDVSAKRVEQLTIAHFSNPETNVMFKPVPINQQERLSTLAQQLNKPTESVFKIDAGFDTTTPLNVQRKRIRRSPGTEELIHIASGGTTTQIPLDVDQYPFYVAPPSDGFSKYSALRYASNPKDIPRKTEGGMEFYESRDRLVECEEPTPPKNIVPKRDKDGEWNKNPHSNSPRLGGLGDKISCLKAKYFGKDPLDNPFFKETTVDVPEVFKSGNSEKLEDQLGLYMDIIGNINSNSGISEKTTYQVQKSVNNFLTGQNLKRNVQNTSFLNDKDYNRVKYPSKNDSQENKYSHTSVKPILVYPIPSNNTTSSASISKDIGNLESNYKQQNNLSNDNLFHFQPSSINPGIRTQNPQWNQNQQNSKFRQENLFTYQPVFVHTGAIDPHPSKIYKPKRDYNRILGLRPPLPSYRKIIRVQRLIKPIYQPYNAFNTPKLMINPTHQITQPIGSFNVRGNNYNFRNPNIAVQSLGISGSQSVSIEKKNPFYQVPRTTDLNKSNQLNIGSLKLLSIDPQGRIVAQLTRPNRSNMPLSNLSKRDISRTSFSFENNRIWYPRSYATRRGEPKYSRRKRNADLNTAYINSRESKELINLLLKNKTLLLQAKQDPIESRDVKQRRISDENQQQNIGRKRNVQSSRVGGFISRHNPAYSSRYSSSNSIHDSNLENVSKNSLIFGKIQTTTETSTRKSKVRFPKLNLNSRLVADINVKKNNTQSQSTDVKPIIIIPTTTSTSTEPTTITTTRMYKPRRVYKKEQAKGKVVDVFAVLNRQVSTTSEKPVVENIPIEKTNPRRLQHVEHRRVTKEEVFKKTYIPHGIKDRSEEPYETGDDHPDLRGPVERSSTDYEEGYDLFPEGDMLHNETLVYIVDPKSGIGHWESIPYEKLNSPEFVEETVETIEKRGPKQKIKPDRNEDDINKRQDFEGRKRNTKKDKNKDETESQREGKQDNFGRGRSRQQYEAVEEKLVTSDQPPRRRSRNRNNPNRIRNKVHVLSSLLQQVPPIKYVEQPHQDDTVEHQQPKRYFDPKIILEPDKRNYFFIRERDE